MQSEPLEIFMQVCRRPNMYLQSARYEGVCAFMDGYDMALQGAPLMAFREWLLTKGTEWTNLPWWSLVRKSFDPEADFSQPPHEGETAALVEALARALEGYRGARNMRGGVAKIFYDYSQWVLRLEGGEEMESLRADFMTN
jgi:hypothetical protein